MLTHTHKHYFVQALTILYIFFLLFEKKKYFKILIKFFVEFFFRDLDGKRF
jgi:hypothetical protein